MPLFAKPQFNSVWAATGTRLTPDPAKISQGWIVEIPPHEYENWSQNRQDALLAHINQVGIPMWDATVEYQAGKSYIQGTTSGTIYRAVNTNTNVNPELDIQGNWVVAFEAQGTALLKSQNLADVPDKALARTNLGIPSTVFYDGRYLIKTENFADVPNKATARSNLGLGNSATLNVGTTSNTVAAGNDGRIVNAVQTSRVVTAGDGLTGGGNLSGNIAITLGTPSHITPTSGNNVTPTSHSHAINMSSFFSQKSFQQNGFQIFPGGFCIQWGYVPSIPRDGSVLVNLPQPLTSVFAVTASAAHLFPDDSDGNEVSAWVVSNSQVRVGNSTANYAVDAHWIAVGFQQE